LNFKRRKKRDRLTGDIDSHEWRRAARDRRVAKQPQVHEVYDPTPLYDAFEYDYVIAEPWYGWDDTEALELIERASWYDSWGNED